MLEVANRPAATGTGFAPTSSGRTSAATLEETMDLIKRLHAFVRNEEGQDLLEYALLIALIALVCVGAVALAGTKVSQVFTNIAGAIPAGT
jgi:pilus assembly protein Flp/PilA